MPPTSPWPTRFLGAVALASAGALPFVGGRTVPIFVVLLAGAVGWFFWRIWDESQGRTAVVRGLTARWMELPGARYIHHGVHVHHGMQPLEIHCGRLGGALAVRVSVPLGTSMLAFRLWPDQLAQPPAFEGSATRDRSAPPLDRSVALESLFAGLVRVETNDASSLRGWLTAEVMAPILAVRRELGDAFGGVTWDGRRMDIHLRGPIAADPERALQLARAIWAPWAE